MTSQLKPFFSRMSRYFVAYGGWRAIFGSPLFIVSLGISAVSYESWLHDSWTSMAQSLLPNLLGFSLGTYAILFSLMTNRLKKALKAVKNSRGIAYLDEINATFLHFIVVQVIAILWSIVYRSTIFYDILYEMLSRDPSQMAIFCVPHAVGGLLGFLLLSYSVSLVVGAALAVYRLASLIDPSD